MRIHGNWCGPDWTDGKKQTAESYRLAGGDFTGPCIDDVDCACRAHDKDCSHPDGCSRKADLKLIMAMNRYRFNPYNRIRHPIISARARAIRAGILLAMPFRSR